MNRQKMLTQIGNEIETNLPSLGAWQAVGLAVLVFSLIAQGRAQVSKLAEGVPEEGSYNTVRQRLKRWLSNPRLNWERVGDEWVRWVWSRYGCARAVLLVDETKLGDRFGVMMVSLAYGQRAIPLRWWVYKANDAEAYPQQGQVLLIYGLLARVLNGLPRQARPLVQMDRGLAHSAAMLRVLRSLKVDFLVRVKSTARFTSDKGVSQWLKGWVKGGDCRHIRGTLFARDHASRGTMCLIWENGQAEPWCLFTNLRSNLGHVYALRWWQEESFRDLKSGGWQWETSHLICPRRMERLLLVMAIAYALTLSSGVAVWHQAPRQRAETATSDELPRLSLFTLGWRWLKRVLADVIPFPGISLNLPAPAFFRRI